MAADPALREALSDLTNTMLIRRCAQLELTTPDDITSAALYTLHLLARRILELTNKSTTSSSGSPTRSPRTAQPC